MWLTVLIAWSNRPELRNTISALHSAAVGRDIEIVVVNNGGCKLELNRLLDGFDAVRQLQIPGLFNKSRALNVGAAHSNAEIIAIMDADILVPLNYFENTANRLSEFTFCTVDQVVETEPKSLGGSYLVGCRYDMTFALRDGREIRIPLNHLRYDSGSRRGCGLLTVRRTHFRSVGGLNSALQGWGWEDNDLTARLQMKLNLHHFSAAEVIHISHSDGVRDLRGRTRLESEEANLQRCLENYQKGFFEGTLEWDYRSWQDENNGGLEG